MSPACGPSASLRFSLVDQSIGSSRGKFSADKKFCAWTRSLAKTAFAAAPSYSILNCTVPIPPPNAPSRAGATSNRQTVPPTCPKTAGPKSRFPWSYPRLWPKSVSSDPSSKFSPTGRLCPKDYPERQSAARLCGARPNGSLVQFIAWATGGSSPLASPQISRGSDLLAPSVLCVPLLNSPPRGYAIGWPGSEAPNRPTATLGDWRAGSHPWR